MKRTLLVVTRDAKVRSLVRELRNEARLLEAPDGLRALFFCAREPVDVLVADLTTQGMHWPTLLEKFSAAFPGMPVIATTAEERSATLVDRIRGALDATVLRKEPVRVRAAGQRDERTA